MKISILIISLLMFSCSVDSTKNEFRIFEKHKKNNNYEKSLISLNKIISTSQSKKNIKKAYLEMADLNLENLKNPESAIMVYQKLAKLSEKNIEKNEYKYLIAKIFFENLNDFDLAIKAAKSIQLDKSEVDMFLKVEKILVQSYLNKKNYFQALIEVNKVLANSKIDDENYFEFNMLKASIFSLQNKYAESNQVYNDLVTKYPSKAINEKIFLNVLSNHEAVGAYDKAIKLLEASINRQNMDKEFFNSKLKRLTDLKNNMPGAKGLSR